MKNKKYFVVLGFVAVLLLMSSLMQNMISPDIFGTPEGVDQKTGSYSHESETKPRNKKQKKGKNIWQRAPKQAEIVRAVDKEKRYYLLSVPNDPLYSSSYVFSAVKAVDAWAVHQDASDVTIAVLDSGFALSHQDLVDRWYINPGESGGGKESNGIDDDGNGYVDDWRGWDFASVDNSPQAGSTNSSGEGVSHGTEVAGLAGATSNNGIGIASLARNPTLMPLQVMSDNGVGHSGNVAAAIHYAVDQGANVINMSLGTAGDDSAVREAVDYAITHNVIVVAAAGNCGNSSEDVCAGQPAGAIMFPASYDRVIAVGATNAADQRASFSSYGNRLDVVAPGSGALVSTAWSSGNQTMGYKTTLHGTSYASPIVASSTALLKSLRPHTSVDDLRAILLASGRKVSSMSSRFYTSSYGHGVLNSGLTLQVADSLNQTDETEPLLYQTGNEVAEKRFRATDSLSSGCTVAAGSYCTVWLRNTSQNFDRYLPYQQANTEGETGWGWSARGLETGEWLVYAVQGTMTSSSPLLILNK